MNQKSISIMSPDQLFHIPSRLVWRSRAPRLPGKLMETFPIMENMEFS